MQTGEVPTIKTPRMGVCVLVGRKGDRGGWVRTLEAVRWIPKQDRRQDAGTGHRMCR